MEGEHAKVTKIIKHAPHHSDSLVSNEARFPELEAAMEHDLEESMLNAHLLLVVIVRACAVHAPDVFAARPSWSLQSSMLN